jgi:hypothetical protein
VLGRVIWQKWSGYHRRSLVETKMRCFKLLGERVMARTFGRQGETPPRLGCATRPIGYLKVPKGVNPLPAQLIQINHLIC